MNSSPYVRTELFDQPDWQLNSLLRSVGAKELGRLVDQFHTRKVVQGEELLSAGVMNTEVFFPQTAIISHFYLADHGSSVETALIGPEGGSGLCSISSRKAPRHSAAVTVAGTVTAIRLADLAAGMAASPKLQNALFDYLLDQVAESGQRLTCAVFHLAEERLCSWLLLLRERAGTSNLRITHEEMANLLGINRTSVSFIAKRLKDQGAIDYLRGKLHILDIESLKRSACECHAPGTQRVTRKNAAPPALAFA